MEQDESTRHSRSRHGAERRDESCPLICVDSTRDADGTQWKMKFKKEEEEEEKLVEKEKKRKKSSRSVYVPKFGSYFAFLS